MTTKELTRRQAQWAETLGCFNFEIIFRPGRQSTKPNALSHRPDLAPAPREKLIFGQLLTPSNITEQTFSEKVEIVEAKYWFEDKLVNLEDVDHWFEINILGVNPKGVQAEHLFLSDVELIADPS